MIVKTGNINTSEGLQIYICNQDEIIGKIILNNFEQSLLVHKTNLDILCDIESPVLNKSNSIFLRSFEIKDEFRNNGYGKKLFSSTITETKKFNVEYLFLICKKDNFIAKNMYQKNGFVDYHSNKTDVLMYKHTPHQNGGI
jgi:GNAT superfamily N-acetyltransferase